MYFLKIHTPPFRSVIRSTPPPTPQTYNQQSILVLTNRTPTLLRAETSLTSLSSRYLYFWPQLPIPPYIPSQDFVKPIKQTSMFNIFERIRRVPQQRGRPYLKETQPERKPETCTVKRDPFTFI